MPTTEVHGYFADKARSVFAKAGGNPDRSGSLARWAQDAKAAGDSRLGVILDDRGVILAETRHVPSTISSPGVTYAATGGPDVKDREVGLAMAALRRATGRAVIHVKYSEVCQGAGRTGRPPKHTEPLVPVTLRLPESVHRAVTEAAQGAGRSVNDEIIARCSRA